jgi:hypothetical protein
MVMANKTMYFKFLKSEKGGISNLIFEVVIAAVALSLLVVVISLFRGNMDIIGNSAKKANDLDKVKATSLSPDTSSTTVEGKDIVAVIRWYYLSDPAMNISVQYKDDLGNVLNKTFNKTSPYTNELSNLFTNTFTANYSAMGAQIETITYTIN